MCSLWEERWQNDVNDAKWRHTAWCSPRAAVAMILSCSTLENWERQQKGRQIDLHFAVFPLCQLSINGEWKSGVARRATRQHNEFVHLRIFTISLFALVAIEGERARETRYWMTSHCLGRITYFHIPCFEFYFISIRHTKSAALHILFFVSAIKVRQSMVLHFRKCHRDSRPTNYWIIRLRHSHN